MVELIPGTSIPITTPGMAEQPEGRGGIQLRPERQPPALVDGDPTPDEVSAMQQRLMEAAIRAYDRAPKLDRTIAQSTAGQTDATTGNLVLELFECPQGKEGRVTNVTVDLPGSATITPAAPFANASSWAFLAALGPTSGLGNGNPTGLRAGMVAFAPTSAAGPILPGQWTFNEDESPILWGGQMLYFVLVGGSVAAITNVLVECSYRVNLYGQR